MQGCRKRGKGGKHRAAAKLLCIVAGRLNPRVGGRELQNNRLRSVHSTAGGGSRVDLPVTHLPPCPSSVKSVAKRGSRLLSSVPTMLITRLDFQLKHTFVFSELFFVQNEEPVGDNTVPVNRPPSKQKQMTPQVRQQFFTFIGIVTLEQ
jgi:hypothetical protein